MVLDVLRDTKANVYTDFMQNYNFFDIFLLTRVTELTKADDIM